MKQEQFLHVVDRDEAERAFRAALGDLSPRRTEVVALEEALGRVLAEDICSPIDVPGFDAGQVQQVVDDGLQALAVLARGEQEIGLLFRERPRHLFGAQVQRHP